MRSLTVFVLVAFVALASPAPVTAAPGRCYVKGARLLAKDSEARVWRGRGTVWACLRHQKPRAFAKYTLPSDDSTNTLSVRHLQLAGTYIAYEASCSCKSENYSILRRQDLSRTRRQPGEVANTVGSGEVAPTTRIVLRADGALAWIGVDYFAEPDRRELWKADGEGVAQIDGGDLSDYLQLQGEEVLWSKDGASYSRPLAGLP